MQHVVGVAQRHAFASRLQPGTHAGNRAVVVHALNVDGLGVAALPLGQVVSHVRHKVGVRAISLFHDPVLVVAVVGGPEPQRATFFKRFACGFELGDRALHPARLIQARLKVIVVEAHRKRLQIKVLLMAQIGHGKLANRVQVFNVTRRGEFTVVGLDGFARHEIGGNVGDVVAVVGQLGPGGVAGLEALGARLGAGG